MTRLKHLCPSEGRFRAELMSCDQITSLIYVNLPSFEVKDKFRLAELQDALANAPQHASRKDAFATVPESVKDYYASYGHELDHLHRQLSTSCGFLCMHLHCLLTWAARELIGMWIKDQDTDMPFPILPRYGEKDWLLDGISEYGALHRYCCEGGDKAFVLAAGAAAAGLYGIERGARVADRVLADAGMVLSAGRPDRFAAIGFAHPHIKPEIDEWLGAQDLYEQMAMLQELQYRTQIGGGMEEWQKLLACDTRYRRILLLWHHFFPDAHLLDKDPMRPTDVINDIYRAFPVEFYAIVDLAMWIPYTPDGFRVKDRPLRWEDVQPGTRFLRAVECLKRLDAPLTPVSSPKREARFDQVQQQLARDLNWESPSELVKEWHDYFTTDRWLDSNVFVAKPANPMARLARALLARRLACAFDAVCSNTRAEHNQGLGFNLWMTQEGDAGCRIHAVGDKQEAVLARHNYYLFRGFDVLLFGRDRMSHLIRLDEVHRREALDTLVEALEVGQSDRSRFREAAISAFDL